MTVSQAILAAPILSAGFALSFLGSSRRHLSVNPLLIYWALASLGIFSFCLIMAAGENLGVFYPFFAFACSATCGITWLLARTIFRPQGAVGRWPVVLVIALYATGLIIDLTAHLPQKMFVSTIDNVHTLISSTVLLLTLIEPLEGYRKGLPIQEKRFRQAFLLGYSLLLTCAVILQRGAADEGTQFLDPSVVKVICAVFAIGAYSAATRYRLSHPLPARIGRASKSRSETPADFALGEKISALLAHGDIYKDPQIKVADLAQRLGEPDYKVTQAITGGLGFQNFNRLINHHRIEQAKNMLGDPAHKDQSILSIAMECGFGSIGPFNRAFKESVGETPGAYRNHQASTKLQQVI